MKTQISYRKLDGSEGVALVNGGISDARQAKQELAKWLPAVNAANAPDDRNAGRGRRSRNQP